jgi:uncharacterized protein (TIGR02145 family)
MKKTIFLVLMLFVLSVANVRTQVRIGGIDDPHGSAVLDLNENNTAMSANLGLALPRVAIDDVDEASPVTNPAVGLMVFNTKPNTINGKGVGAYVWDGSKWQALKNCTLAPDSPTIQGDDANDDCPDVVNTYFVEPDANTIAYVWTVPSGWSIISGNGSNRISVRTPAGATSAQTGDISVFAFNACGVSDAVGFAVTVPVICLGESTMTIGSNDYKVYTYPDNIGTWMVENSKEGTSYFAKAYGATDLPDGAGDYPAGARGYYYTWEQAMLEGNACPDGWSLPNSAQWTALVNYLNSAGIDNRDQYWGQNSELAGYYYSYYDVWANWDDSNVWWVSGVENVMVAFGWGADWTVLVGPQSSNGWPGSVRCIKG